MTSLKTAGVSAEFRTTHLMNRSLEHYGYINLLNMHFLPLLLYQKSFKISVEKYQGPPRDYRLIVENKFARHNDPESYAGGSGSSW
jgi:hypothetical protein